MALTIHGITYNTAKQLNSRIAELTYMNRVLGESDDRVTELNAIFSSVKPTTSFETDTNKIEVDTNTTTNSSYYPANVFFDEGEPIPALVSTQRWNGWTMPLISVKNARQNLLKTGFYETFEITDDGIHYIDGNENRAHAPLTTLDGETFYDFGKLGLCWNQKAL